MTRNPSWLSRDIEQISWSEESTIRQADGEGRGDMDISNNGEDGANRG
jgi:hypothetical protein